MYVVLAGKTMFVSWAALVFGQFAGIPVLEQHNQNLAAFSALVFAS